MINNSRQRHYHLGRWYQPFAMLLCLLVTSPVAQAGEVTQVRSIAFGSIDLHPGGDTITIAAENGPASPQPLASRSLVSGGRSGLITITSTGVEHVDILYPPSVALSNGSHNITISDIPVHSEYNVGGVDLPGSGIPVDISVGGKLVLQGNEVHGSYSGSMTILLNFF